MPVFLIPLIVGGVAGGIGGFVVGGGTKGVGNTIKYVVIGAGLVFTAHQLGYLRGK